MLKEFIVSLSAIFLSELGDKTMFVTLALATRYGAVPVLSGILLGTGIVMILPVLAGFSLKFLVSQNVLMLIASGIFIFSGAYFLLDLFREEEEKEVEKERFKLPVWIATAIVIILLEFGDKTQLVTLGLAASMDKPLLVWSGATIGMFVADSSSLVLLPVIRKIDEKFVNIFMGIVFILLGIAGIIRVVV